MRQPLPLRPIGIYDREGYCCCSAMCSGYEAINGGSSQYITVGEPAYKRKSDDDYREGLGEMMGAVGMMGGIPANIAGVARLPPGASTFSRTAPPSGVVSAEMWTGLIESLEAGFAGNQSSWNFFSYWCCPLWLHECAATPGDSHAGCCCCVQSKIVSTTQSVVDAHKASFAAAGVELQVSRMNKQRFDAGDTGDSTNKLPYLPVSDCLLTHTLVAPLTRPHVTLELR